MHVELGRWEVQWNSKRSFQQGSFGREEVHTGPGKRLEFILRMVIVKVLFSKRRELHFRLKVLSWHLFKDLDFDDKHLIRICSYKINHVL